MSGSVCLINLRKHLLFFWKSDFYFARARNLSFFKRICTLKLFSLGLKIKRTWLFRDSKSPQTLILFYYGWIRKKLHGFWHLLTAKECLGFWWDFKTLFLSLTNLHYSSVQWNNECLCWILSGREDLGLHFCISNSFSHKLFAAVIQLQFAQSTDSVPTSLQGRSDVIPLRDTGEEEKE